MKTQHTPGPWVVAEDQVGDDDGNVIADVILVNEWDTTEGFVTKEMPWEANAKLIAAAPDLLEMVNRLSKSLTRTNDDDQRLYLEAREFIAELTEE